MYASMLTHSRSMNPSQIDRSINPLWLGRWTLILNYDDSNICNWVPWFRGIKRGVKCCLFLLQCFTFGCSNVKGCSQVIVPLLHVHRRQCQPGNIVKVTHTHLRTFRLFPCLFSLLAASLAILMVFCECLSCTTTPALMEFGEIWFLNIQETTRDYV